jgi:hypothetical protein
MLRPNCLILSECDKKGEFLRFLKILFENIGEKFFHVVP